MYDKRKGFVSYIGLIMMIICSFFIFYFMNMNQTHSIGIYVKHGLDRSVKAGCTNVNKEKLKDGYFKIDADKSKDIFETMINKNLNTEDKIRLNPIRQDKEGVNYVYQYRGKEDFNNNKSRLDKTPTITYFVFNADNDIVSNSNEDITLFITKVKETLQSVQISDDGKMDKKIKNTIFAELTGRKIDGVSTNITSKIVDTRSFVLAVTEIPTDTFRGDINSLFRFSTARLNSKVDTVQECSKEVIHGLRGEYYSHEIPEGCFSPTTIKEKLAERIDKTINFGWGQGKPHPNVPATGFTVEWTGLVKAPITGVVNFQTITDDGVRLWIDSTLIIDKWIQSAKEWNGTITLQKDKWYPIKMQYYQNTGLATAKLLWKYGDMVNAEIIPSNYLLPYTTNYEGESPNYSKTFTVTEPTGIPRFKEIIEIPVIFDDDKMVKQTTNMVLLDDSKKIPFVLDNITRGENGFIKKGTLVFIDDLKPNEIKQYTLVFSEGITHIPLDSGIKVTEDSSYITIKNNDLYSLKFRKKSKAGYTQAYINNSNYDAIGEKATRNFYFSTKQQESDWSDWGNFKDFKILENNNIYTTVEYTVKDISNLLEYNLLTTYYKNSPIIKNKVYNTNISEKPLLSFNGGHFPMLEQTSTIDGMEAWGVDSNNSIIEGKNYLDTPNTYTGTGVAYWSNDKNYEIGLHALQGFATVDVQYNKRISLNFDNEQHILKPNEKSKEMQFWISISHNDYLGDGRAVAQNITQRLTAPVHVSIN